MYNPKFPSILFRVTRIAVLSLFAIGLPITVARAEEGIDVESIREGINHTFDKIKSLAVAYRSEPEAIVSEQDIKRYLGRNYLATQYYTFAFKGEKRYYRHSVAEPAPPIAPGVSPEWAVLPGGAAAGKKVEDQYARALKAAGKKPTDRSLPVLQPGSGEEAAFDGIKLLRRMPDRLMAQVYGLDQLREISDGYNQEYMVSIGSTLPQDGHYSPQHPTGLRQLLADGEFTESPTASQCDGASCFLLTFQSARVWVDPSLGFAVRRREVLDPTTGVLLRRYSNFDFVTMPGAVSLPRTFVVELCGPALATEPYRGSPLVRYHNRVSSLSINNVRDELFTLSIDPGFTVFDWTVLPSAESPLDSAIAYKMPASKAHLNAVIDRAIRDHQSSEYAAVFQKLLLIGNVAVVLLVAGWLLLKRIRRTAVH